MKRTTLGKKRLALGKDIFKSVYGRKSGVKEQFMEEYDNGEMLFKFTNSKNQELYIVFYEDFATTYTDDISYLGIRRD